MKNIFSKYQKDNIDQELVVAIRGEVLADGKWTMHAEADDVRKLIEKGAANTHKDRAGGTPLHECCHIGLVEHAKVHKIRGNTEVGALFLKSQYSGRKIIELLSFYLRLSY